MYDTHNILLFVEAYWFRIKPTFLIYAEVREKKGTRVHYLSDISLAAWLRWNTRIFHKSTKFDENYI